MKTCHYRKCDNKFKQNRSWHRYCSDVCRTLENTEMEKVRKPIREAGIKKCHCGCGQPVGHGLYWLSEYCYKKA